MPSTYFCKPNIWSAGTWNFFKENVTIYVNCVFSHTNSEQDLKHIFRISYTVCPKATNYDLPMINYAVLPGHVGMDGQISFSSVL